MKAIRVHDFGGPEALKLEEVTKPIPGTGEVVEAVGEGVTKVQPSDRVYTADSISGAYAEFTLCKAEDVHKLPDNISFEEAAGLNIPYATAYRALFQKAKAQPGETVFVHGASGGVGTAA